MIPIQELRAKAATHHVRDLIWDQLRSTKVVIGQLDPNGLCNANCWFCPVKYEGNPPEYVHQMAPEEFDLILRRIREATVVDQSKFPFIFTAHYNEVLLYKHFDKTPDLFRKNRFISMVLSNGTPLVPAKTDIIMANPDVFMNIYLNIPAIERSDWAEKAGFPEKTHEILLRNLDYLHEKAKIPIMVGNNLISEYWKDDLLSEGFYTPLERAQRIMAEFKDRWPKFQVSIADGLVDRAGALAKVNVLKNKRAIMMPGQKVIGCHHDLDTTNSRIYGWLHINSKGDLFVCCDDYEMKYKFGNLLETPLDEIWLSERHVDVLEQAFKELCMGCCHHITA